jgi:phosphoglycolate phosphatase
MNLLFDLDGTLTDPFEGITKCIAHALEEMGRPSPDRGDLRWCIGPPLRKSFARLLDSDDMALAERALMIYRERFGSIGLFENRVYEDIPEVLDTLKKNGHVLFVATSKPEVYAARIIDHFGLRRLFKNVYGSELSGARGDKKDLISHILEKEAISSSETMMIGDRKHDMIGAAANAVSAAGVLWGYGTKAELEKSGAYTCLEQPRELVEVFV